jgi:hypothetical protein
MGLKNNSNISTTKRYWNIINNGLLLFGIRNRLAKIGLDINPYYWVQEEVEPCEEPKIKGDSTEYLLRSLDIEELKLIISHSHLVVSDREEMIKGLNNGQLCIGLEHNNEIAAYMFIELNDFTFNHRTFKLKDNEAYLLNMWTLHSFRGNNLAPYLRYQSYQMLKEQGRDVKFSITQYFNKSSIKFKKKLNSKHLKLYLSIVLFKKYYWNLLIREYK